MNIKLDTHIFLFEMYALKYKIAFYCELIDSSWVDSMGKASTQAIVDINLYNKI